VTKKVTKASGSKADSKPKTNASAPPPPESGTPPADDKQDPPPAHPPKKEEKKVASGMKSYFDTYPDETEFLRSSDGQVFLSKDRQWAALHQKSIDPQKAVETIKR